MSATEKTHKSAIKHIGIGAAATSAAIGAGMFALGDAAFRTACDVRSPLFIKSNKRAIEEIGEQLKQQDNDEQRVDRSAFFLHGDSRFVTVMSGIRFDANTL